MRAHITAYSGCHIKKMWQPLFTSKKPKMGLMNALFSSSASDDDFTELDAWLKDNQRKGK